MLEPRVILNFYCVLSQTLVVLTSSSSSSSSSTTPHFNCHLEAFKNHPYVLPIHLSRTRTNFCFQPQCLLFATSSSTLFNLEKKLALDASSDPNTSWPYVTAVAPPTQHMDVVDGVAGESMGAGAEMMEGVDLSPSEEESYVEPSHEELESLQEQLSNSIAVRFRRQPERKAKRVRAAEKASTDVASFKPGSSRRRKRVSMQEVDYSDPLCYLRTTTTTSRLLTSTEEIKLSEGIQDLLKLERLQEDLVERCGGLPTFAQWAAVAGVDQKTLRKR